MERAAKTNDDIAFMRLDRELNRLMIEAAHNELRRALDEAVAGAVAAILVHALSRSSDLPLCARLHAEQARAIAQGQCEAGCRRQRTS